MGLLEAIGLGLAVGLAGGLWQVVKEVRSGNRLLDQKTKRSKPESD